MSYEIELTNEDYESILKSIKEKAFETLPEEWKPTQQDIKWASENSYKFYSRWNSYSEAGAIEGGFARTKDTNKAFRKAIALLFTSREFKFSDCRVYGWHRATPEIKEKAKKYYQPLVVAKIAKLNEAYEAKKIEREENFENLKPLSVEDIKSGDIIFVKDSNSFITDDKRIYKGKVDINLTIDFGYNKISIGLEKLPQEIIEKFKDRIKECIDKHNIRKA